MPKRKKASEKPSDRGSKRKKPSQVKPSGIEERFTDLDKHPETAFSGSKAKLTHGHDQEEEEEWLKSQPAYTLFWPAHIRKACTRGLR